MSKWIFVLLQFFPLSLFASYAYWHGIPTNERWLEAFQLSAIAGIIQLAILLPQPRPVNRLVLAGNVYLILGGLAGFTEQWWYLAIYNELRESAIFIFMIAIGIITTFASNAGFAAIQNVEKKITRKTSYILLIATACMLSMAMIFEGNRLLSAVLPIILLALLQRILNFKYRPLVQS